MRSASSTRFTVPALLRGLLLAAVVLVGDVTPMARAQEAPAPGLVAPGTWQAFPAMNRIQAATSGGGALWGGTDGGVFRYDVDSGELTRYTTVDGLARSDVRSLLFDERLDVVWIGYADGVFDRLDVNMGDIATYHDIARADRYPQRGINRFRSHGDLLFIATDFGIVEFDPVGGEVLDTYDKFGHLDRGQPAYDIVAAPRPDGVPAFWVGTRDGVAYARQDEPNLRAPSAWVVDELAPSPALALGYFRGAMNAGRAETPDQAPEVGDMWRRQADGSWTRQHMSGQSVFDVIIEDGRMSVLSTFWVSVVWDDGSRVTVQVREMNAMLSGTRGPDGRLWMGSRVFGFGRLPALEPATPTPIEPEEVVSPAGPLSNLVTAVGLGADGDVWVGYRPQFGFINGMGHFDGVRWKNYYSSAGYDAASAPIRAITSDSRGMVWGASENDGLMRIAPDGSVVTFREDNSTLRREPGHANIVVLGVAEDVAGNVWATNRGAPTPLHRWNPDEGWTAISRPPGTPHGAWFASLTIDRFDQKWIGLIRTTPGFIVIRTDPNDVSQAEAVAHTGAGSAATGTGLPSQHVTSIVEDLSGRIWIGTQRGLAVVFSPGSIFGNPALAVPSWARTADQASYFLRDLRINAMAVDPSGRLWLASSDGVWLLNSQGNAVEAHFTPENSPLPSASVVDVAVDGSNGTVWFATDAGVMSYRGVSIDPSPAAERLRVYPNPYRPAQDPFVRVEGLVAETRIRVLTADGQVVAAFDGRGGSATWDGRDQRTGQLVPSGVYIVSAAGLNGEGTAHARIAVIR